MGLIKCVDCGKEISDRAVACPNCGCPVTASLEAIEESLTQEKTEVSNLEKTQIKIRYKMCKQCGKDMPETDNICPKCDCNQKEYNPFSSASASSSVSNSSETTKKDPNVIQIDDARKDELRRELRAIESSANTVMFVITSLLGGIFVLYGWILFFSGLGSGAFVIIMIGACPIFIAVIIKQSRKSRREEILKILNSSEMLLVCPFCKKSNIKSEFVNTGSYTSGQTVTVKNNKIKTSGTTTTNNYGTIYHCESCRKTFNQPYEIYQ